MISQLVATVLVLIALAFAWVLARREAEVERRRLDQQPEAGRGHAGRR